MNKEIVTPNIKNFIKSLRDIGYSLDIAIADIIDNSITAKAKNIYIQAHQEPELTLSIFDDGYGMNELEVVEAMRLSSKDPDEIREKDDLGKFGLGLKTASFSQCKKITVLSKKGNNISAKRWDLDYISESNEWYLITPQQIEIENYFFYKKLLETESGTVIVWENIDRYPKNDFINLISSLQKHLSLVFHRFIEENKIKIYINNGEIEAFNPFNPDHLATQQIPIEEIVFQDEKIKIQPYILPHHSKMSQEDYDRYATEDGYIKSQGFYLYRANRLLMYGTWWGLHKANDAHKLVRIKIDISNSQDSYWGIDVKKSIAKPHLMIRNDLKRIISTITPKSSRVYTGKAKILEDRNTEKTWDIFSDDGNFRFGINKEHSLLKKLKEIQNEEGKELLQLYLKMIEMYLPLASIQAHLQEHPLKVKQETALTNDELVEIVEKLKSLNISEEYMQILLKTELVKKMGEILNV
ncbi:MAG: ATP-binding protein [Cetobacterium sp.]